MGGIIDGGHFSTSYDLKNILYNGAFSKQLQGDLPGGRNVNVCARNPQIDFPGCGRRRRREIQSSAHIQLWIIEFEFIEGED